MEDVIVENSPARQSKLYGPAKKAIAAPSTGITVQVPAALEVIRDCATITRMYLPHYLFGLYGNPVVELNRKFSIDQIKDFVARSAENFVTKQLLQLIILRVKCTVNIPEQGSIDPKDVYGDYSETDITQQKVDDIYILSKAFGLLS